MKLKWNLPQICQSCGKQRQVLTHFTSLEHPEGRKYHSVFQPWSAVSFSHYCYTNPNFCFSFWSLTFKILVVNTCFYSSSEIYCHYFLQLLHNCDTKQTRYFISQQRTSKLFAERKRATLHTTAVFPNNSGGKRVVKISMHFKTE